MRDLELLVSKLNGVIVVSKGGVGMDLIGGLTWILELSSVFGRLEFRTWSRGGNGWFHFVISLKKEWNPIVFG
jgi:hypothetical protein